MEMSIMAIIEQRISLPWVAFPSPIIMKKDSVPNMMT
jgi:hypothetical protein